MPRSADDVAKELLTWASAVLPGVAAATQPLGEHARKPGLDVRLLRAAPRPPPRSASPPLIVDLDFLATVQMDDAAAEQHALAELLFAAMDRSDVEILDADVAAICASIGVAPAAGFVMRTPLVRDREPAPVRLVRELVVQTGELGPLAGRVLGPKDTPISGAAVTAVGLNRFVRTDAQGRFRIAAVPTGADVRLVARARGAQVEAVARAGQSVTLRLPLEI